MEKYVCSLELAKRLEELEVKQESEFYWAITEYGNFVLRHFQWHSNLLLISKQKYSAFTVGELGEMLPESVNGATILFYKGDDGDYYAEIDRGGNGMWDKNEANPRAKMLIYLLENKLIGGN